MFWVALILTLRRGPSLGPVLVCKFKMWTKNLVFNSVLWWVEQGWAGWFTSSSSFRSVNGHQVRAEDPSSLSVVLLALRQGEFSSEYFSFTDIFFLRGTYEMVRRMLTVMKTRRKLATFCRARALYGGTGLHALCRLAQFYWIYEANYCLSRPICLVILPSLTDEDNEAQGGSLTH